MSLETMSHDQAINSYAAERYVLGELTETERDAFEGHYFDCATCFEEIKTGAQFLAHAREELGPEPEKGRVASMLGDLRRPAPAFVSAMLLGAVGLAAYQQGVIGGARRPRIEARYFLTEARSGVNRFEVSRKTGLSLSVPFSPKGDYATYQAQIVTESGKTRYTLAIPAQQTGDFITIGLPADELGAGQYSVVIQGLSKDGAATEVSRRSFELVFTD